MKTTSFCDRTAHHQTIVVSYWDTSTKVMSDVCHKNDFLAFKCVDIYLETITSFEVLFQQTQFYNDSAYNWLLEQSVLKIATDLFCLPVS